MSTPDPILLQLTRSLLEAAAEEMGTTLQRVSFSANIKERRDFSCALFDARGQLIAQVAHIPVHLGAMPASVRAVLAGLPMLADGDVAVVKTYDTTEAKKWWAFQPMKRPDVPHVNDTGWARGAIDRMIALG